MNDGSPRTVNPYELGSDPACNEGVMTTHMLAAMLKCTQRTILNWIDTKKIPAFCRDAASTISSGNSKYNLRSESIRGGVQMVSCLQMYYFFKKSGYLVTENMIDNAARHLYYYGHEPDQTLTLKYRTYSLPGDFDHPDNLLHIYNRAREMFQGYTSFHAHLQDFLHGKLTEEKRMTFLQQQGLLAVRKVSESPNGLLTMADIAFSLNCSRSNISAMCKSGQLPVFKLPGQGKSLFVTGLQYYYYLVRRRYVPHHSVMISAANSVRTYGWEECPVTGRLATHEEIGVSPKACPYPAALAEKHKSRQTPKAS